MREFLRRLYVFDSIIDDNEFIDNGVIEDLDFLQREVYWV